ncbi:MAG: tRNA (adenosine(37)-N6)-dimethylallyltransferase MiaA, partial [Acidimicrobiales bacterium]
PTAAKRADVPYFLVDLIDPDQEMTVKEFQRQARAAREAATAAGRPCLYVGGTGLYARAVLDDLEIPGRFPEARDALEADAANDLAALYARLVTLDPVAAARMEPTNERRVVRALEVTLGSGRAFSSYGEGLGDYGAVNVPQVGLRVDPAEVDRRIDERFHRWLDEGLLDEVRALAARPAGLSRTARQAVGYRELLRHVEDGVALSACVADALSASRRLARRQRRWFARDPRIEWFDDVGAARRRLVAALNDARPEVRD